MERQSLRGKNIALIFEKTSTGNGNGTGGETGGDIARRRGSYDIMGRVSALILVSARLSLGRLHGQLDYDSVPPRSGTRYAPAWRPQAMFAARSTVHPGDGSMDQAGSLGDFADKPLVVLTAGSRSDAAWSAAQNDLPTLSPNSVHRVIDGTTHISLIVDEDDAAATTQAILDVVSWVRSAGRWSGEAQPREDLDLLVLALDGPGCKALSHQNPYVLDRGFAHRPSGHRAAVGAALAQTAAWTAPPGGALRALTGSA